MTNFRRISNCWRVLAAGLLLLVATREVSARELTASQLERQLSEIQGMKENERDELGKELRRFQSLSKEDRENLQKLERELRSDPELKELMNLFVEWYSSLTPAEKQRLLKGDGPNSKLEIMRDLLNNPADLPDAKPEPHKDGSRGNPKPDYSDKPPKQNNYGRPGDGENRFGNNPGGRAAPPLDRQDVYAVVAKLESVVRPTLSSDQRKELERLEVCPRYLRMMDMLIAKELQELNNRSDKPPEWARDDKKMEDVLYAISDTRLQERLRKDENRELMRAKLLVGVSSGLLVEYYSKHRPDQRKLDAYLKQLGPDSKQEFEGLPEWQRKERLYEAYVAGHPGEYPDFVRNLPDAQRKYMARVYMKSGGRDRRGPGGGFDSDRKNRRFGRGGEAPPPEKD